MKDVIVIGGGPGGYVAAIRAAQLGLNVSLVEKEHLGGVCLNWGCIPTKALLTCAETYSLLHHLEDFGLAAKDVSFDMGAMVDQSRRISETLANGVQHLLKKNKIKVIKGHGTLHPPKNNKHTVQVEGDTTQTLSADAVIIATGASPLVLPGVQTDHKQVWTSKESMLQRTPPKSLLVIGSGAIGLEFASFYASFGTKVTIVELQDRLLPAADPFLSDELLKAFQKRGIDCYLKHRVLSSKVEKGQCILTMDDGKTLQSEALLLAVGVKANIENVGLETLGIETQRGRIKVNQMCETSQKNIYAIGDVIDEPWLAHKASHEGIMVAEHLAGQKVHSIAKENIPTCVYSSPQIASIGLTEPQAKAKGFSLKVGTFPLMANGKALSMHAKQGGIKTILDAKTGALLGAHLIGPGVTELVATLSLAKIAELTDEDLAQTIFPHPTLSEAVHESVLAAMGRGIHF